MACTTRNTDNGTKVRIVFADPTEVTVQPKYITVIDNINSIDVIKVIEKGPKGDVGERGQTGLSKPFFEISQYQYATTSSIEFRGSISSSFLPVTSSGNIISPFSLGSSSHVWNELYIATSSIYLMDGNGIVATIKANSTGLQLTGSYTGSFKGDATNLRNYQYQYIANKPTLLSGSAQIASNISGSFRSVSASFANTINNIDVLIPTPAGQLTFGNTTHITSSRNLTFDGSLFILTGSALIYDQLKVYNGFYSYVGAEFSGDVSFIYGFRSDNVIYTPGYLAAYAFNGNVGLTFDTTDGDEKLYLEVNGSPKFTILQNGNVGIGTSTPTQKLHIIGNQIITGSLFISGSGITIDRSLYSYKKNIDVDSAGSRLIATVITASYRGAFFDYVAISASNSRAGTVMSTWNRNGSVTYTDTSTIDVGSTTGVNFTVELTGSNAILKAQVSSNNWEIRTMFRAL